MHRGRLVVHLMSGFIATAILCPCAPVLAHPGHEPYAAVKRGEAQAENNRVEIVEREGYRYIAANGIPNHATGDFPNRGNPNAISPQSYHYRVTLEPKANKSPTPMRMSPFGVAINGVPFDPGTAEFWRRDPRSGWNEDSRIGSGFLGMDQNNAHVQPSGAYHYHGIPTGLVRALGGDEKTMLLVEWAADGFPIYSSRAHEKADDASSPLKVMTSSYRLKKGTRPGGDRGPGGKYDGTYVQDWEYVKGAGDLDECNGRTGVTPEFPDGTYYYVLTEDFPFIPRMWRGTPDESFNRRPPPGGPGRPGAAGGRRGDRPPPPR